MIYVVGIGPGGGLGRTAQANEAMARADVFAGYGIYIDLVKKDYPSKEIIQTGMHGEIARCQMALACARTGKTVAMICSGDAAVYGMAALLIELSSDADEIEVVPGVTAALSASALLGAPISGDFSAISLSDLLTPWMVIERRLCCAADGDFVIVLYNPASHTRTDHLRRACEVILKHRAGSAACGWARNIGRVGEETQLLTLRELKETKLDMFTTVVIGNSQTYVKGNKLVTPRGYKL